MWQSQSFAEILKTLDVQKSSVINQILVNQLTKYTQVSKRSAKSLTENFTIPKITRHA